MFQPLNILFYQHPNGIISSFATFQFFKISVSQCLKIPNYQFSNFPTSDLPNIVISQRSSLLISHFLNIISWLLSFSIATFRLYNLWTCHFPNVRTSEFRRLSACKWICEFPNIQDFNIWVSQLFRYRTSEVNLSTS